MFRSPPDLTYSFNHEEACNPFGQAIAHDGSSSIAYLGFAQTAGPIYNGNCLMFHRNGCCAKQKDAEKLREIYHYLGSDEADAITLFSNAYGDPVSCLAGYETRLADTS